MEASTPERQRICAGREVSKRCERFHRAAKKDMSAVLLKEKEQKPVFGGASERSRLESLSKVSAEISAKTLRSSKIRNCPVSADSLLKNVPSSSDLTQTWSFRLALPESLLFILPYPGCVQSIHNCPVFLINHKRFLFCLQLVLG